MKSSVLVSQYYSHPKSPSEYCFYVLLCLQRCLLRSKSLIYRHLVFFDWTWHTSGYYLMVCHFQRIMCHFERTRIYPRKTETHHHHWNELGFSSLGWLNTIGIRLGLTWTGRPGGHGLLTPSFLPGCLGHLYFPVWGKNSTESTKVSVSVAFKPRD